MENEPVEAYVEPWNEINADVWEVTDPATALAVTIEDEHKCIKMELLLNEVARLREDFPLEASPVLFGSDSLNKRFFMKFWIKLTTLANIDQGLTFFGLSKTTGAIRTTNDLIGFYLSSDEWATLIDEGSSEQGNSHSSYDPETWELMEIEIKEDTVVFSINNVEVDSFTASTITGPLYPNFFLDTNGDGAADAFIGKYKRFFSPDVTDSLEVISDELGVVDGIVDDILVDTSTTLPAEHAALGGKLDTIDGNVDDIETLLGIVDGKVDTIDGIVDAILVDTGTTLPAEHATIVTDIASITGGGSGATYNITNSMKDNKNDFAEIKQLLSRVKELENYIKKKVK